MQPHGADVVGGAGVQAALERAVALAFAAKGGCGQHGHGDFFGVVGVDVDHHLFELLLPRATDDPQACPKCGGEGKKEIPIPTVSSGRFLSYTNGYGNKAKARDRAESVGDCPLSENCGGCAKDFFTPYKQKS